MNLSSYACRTSYRFLTYSTDKEPMLCSANFHHAEWNKDTFTHLLEYLQQKLDHGMKKILHVKKAKPVNLHICPVLSSQTSCMASKFIFNQKKPAYAPGQQTDALLQEALLYTEL